MTGDGEGSLPTLPFISSTEELVRTIALSPQLREEIDLVARHYPFSIPKYYLDLIDPSNPSCPIARQAIPSIEELARRGGYEDPLGEESSSPVPGVVQRYPGRAVLLVTSSCAMYCRFCNRKRLAGRGRDFSTHREGALRYLEEDGAVREVILSGGDPLTADPAELEEILLRLRRTGHVRIVRLSSRLPVVFPEGLRSGHLRALEKASPVWMVVHVNHPRELTPEALDALTKLRKAGCPLVSQTVLLRGVNDCPRVLLSLFETLVSWGVKPYYLFQLDEVRGASHFKVKVDRGLDILRHLRVHASGLAVPHFAIDLSGGLGKAPMEHQYRKGRKGTRLTVETPSGKRGIYRDDGGEQDCSDCGTCGDLLSGPLPV